MNRPVQVTDHAIVRYLERVKGMDIDGLRARIAKTCQRGADADAPSIQFKRHRYILSNSVVLTVLGADQTPGHKFLTKVLKR